jgi:hypothetical protein
MFMTASRLTLPANGVSVCHRRELSAKRTGRKQQKQRVGGGLRGGGAGGLSTQGILDVVPRVQGGVSSKKVFLFDIRGDHALLGSRVDKMPRAEPIFPKKTTRRRKIRSLMKNPG